MASQTITADINLTAVIANGLADGENITINNGAVLTVDSPPTVLIGQTVINEGKLLLDGANATDPVVWIGEDSEEINVNGAGVFEVTRGWWEHPTTSTGAASQTWDFASYFSPSGVTADVFSGCWVETGRRIDYDSGSGVAPVVGDWLFKVSDQSVHGRINEVSGDGVTGYVVVQFLTGSVINNDEIELHTIQDNDGADYQISWTADATGADVLEPDVWQEFGNSRQNATNGLSTIGSGMGGFGFEMAHGSNTMSFGDGTNGFIPPSGCKIRVPMVHAGTANLTDYAAGNTTWGATSAAFHELETINGGDCYFDGLSLGSAQFEDSLGGQFQASYCAANLGFGVPAAIGRTTYDHCIFVSEIEGDLRSLARAVPAIVDLVSGADVRDCLGLFVNDSAETTQFGGQTSIGVNIERCIQISHNYSNEFEMVRVNDFTIYDMVVIGAPMVFTTSNDGDIRLIKTQIDIFAETSHVLDSFIAGSSCNNNKVTGWEILNNSAGDDSKCVVADSSNIEIRGFHFIDRKYDNEETSGTQQEEFANVAGLCSDVTFSRCWQDRGNPNEFALIANGTSKNVTVQNCSAEYSGELEPDGINTLFRGIHGGSGSVGAGSGLETDFAGTAGAMCGDAFRSDTQGFVYYRNCPASDDYPVTILAGSPTFTKDGDVDVKTGDSWEVDSGYSVRGHTGFSGVIASTRNAGTTNTVWNWATYMDVELQYDDGSGYNGTWIDVTNTTDMGNIIFNAAGMRFKYKFTATADQTNLQAFTLRTNTTLADQSSNFYPIDVVLATVTFIDVPNGLEARIRKGSKTIDYQPSVSGGEYSYSYTYKPNELVTVTIGGVADDLLAYERQTIRLELSDVSQSIPLEFSLNPSYI